MSTRRSSTRRVRFREPNRPHLLVRSLLIWKYVDTSAMASLRVALGVSLLLGQSLRRLPAKSLRCSIQRTEQRLCALDEACSMKLTWYFSMPADSLQVILVFSGIPEAANQTHSQVYCTNTHNSFLLDPAVLALSSSISITSMVATRLSLITRRLFII